MILRTIYNGHQDRLTCTACGASTLVHKRQTIVLSRRQSGHICGDPNWHVPDYTPTTTRRRRVRQETPA